MGQRPVTSYQTDRGNRHGIFRLILFNDIEGGRNHEFGLDYLAAGIVESKNFDREPNVSGKDYLVVYINPWGVVERQWRAASEIRIYEVGFGDYELLKTAITALEKTITEELDTSDA